DFSFGDIDSQLEILLVVADQMGCADTIQKLINIGDAFAYWIPNAFTPNEDGLNETFKPIFSRNNVPESYHLQIYNRWGDLVFETLDHDEGWTGHVGAKEDAQGVYIYNLLFNDNTGKQYKKKGHLTLIR
ncbi:MAG: gliding motility-associated C-terminal domain-containing protein, partial [Flavobacteriales bacterium]|nr:gliding motility-associated C-terminal domain-containing protein [Flavobacteriales bacterium]